MKTERVLPGTCLKLGMNKDGDCKATIDLCKDCRSSWYLSREEIENHSPSRKDGIDLRKESQLQTLYCSFIQDVGMRLGVPQVTIATAMMLCHRFYLHQSHAKNEWQTIATVCVFLASKVEDTPCYLDKVVIVAYETMYRRDSAAARKIHQKDVLERQKALVVIGERLYCVLLGLTSIQQPLQTASEAFKKLGITQKDVRQVAWNFVNDWLRTTLCLQYKTSLHCCWVALPCL
ncbi:cyclin-T1-2-like isoform X2 [Iris pallida]|uniref:Cyclin-T1-2-like isoform X2 n=1 Tax=Iris pallida TaxID=29817 RepID=A0AAX6DV16_IRIPA|nr:cyclin-T1-2-like isoform X2 [Iris pallida]